VTCGTGVSQRVRTCTGDCVTPDDFVQTQPCNTDPCLPQTLATGPTDEECKKNDKSEKKCLKKPGCIWTGETCRAPTQGELPPPINMFHVCAENAKKCRAEGCEVQDGVCAPTGSSPEDIEKARVAAKCAKAAGKKCTKKEADECFVYGFQCVAQVIAPPEVIENAEEARCNAITKEKDCKKDPGCNFNGEKCTAEEVTQEQICAMLNDDAKGCGKKDGCIWNGTSCGTSELTADQKCGLLAAGKKCDKNAACKTDGDKCVSGLTDKCAGLKEKKCKAPNCEYKDGACVQGAGATIPTGCAVYTKEKKCDKDDSCQWDGSNCVEN